MHMQRLTSRGARCISCCRGTDGAPVHAVVHPAVVSLWSAWRSAEGRKQDHDPAEQCLRQGSHLVPFSGCSKPLCRSWTRFDALPCCHAAGREAARSLTQRKGQGAEAGRQTPCPLRQGRPPASYRDKNPRKNSRPSWADSSHTWPAGSKASLLQLRSFATAPSSPRQHTGMHLKGQHG